MDGPPACSIWSSWSWRAASSVLKCLVSFLSKRISMAAISQNIKSWTNFVSKGARADSKPRTSIISSSARCSLSCIPWENNFLASDTVMYFGLSWVMASLRTACLERASKRPGTLESWDKISQKSGPSILWEVCQLFKKSPDSAKRFFSEKTMFEFMEYKTHPKLLFANEKDFEMVRPKNYFKKTFH